MTQWLIYYNMYDGVPMDTTVTAQSVSDILEWRRGECGENKKTDEEIIAEFCYYTGGVVVEEGEIGVTVVLMRQRLIDYAIKESMGGDV